MVARVERLYFNEISEVVIHYGDGTHRESYQGYGPKAETQAKRIAKTIKNKMKGIKK